MFFVISGLLMNTVGGVMYSVAKMKSPKTKKSAGDVEDVKQKWETQSDRSGERSNNVNS